MKQEGWISKLERAKVGAVNRWPNYDCIAEACLREILLWNLTATFDIEGSYSSQSIPWVHDHAHSLADITRVFDKSIEWAKENTERFDR